MIMKRPISVNAQCVGVESKMRCNGCKHEQHCGEKLYVEHRCWRDVRRGEVCVCECCNCEDCIKEKDDG